MKTTNNSKPKTSIGVRAIGSKFKVLRVVPKRAMEAFRQAVWLKDLQIVDGLEGGIPDLVIEMSYSFSSSEHLNTAYHRWLRGTLASPITVKKIAEKFEYSDRCFNLPLYDLLNYQSNKHLSEIEIDLLVSEYLEKTSEGILVWRLPVWDRFGSTVHHEYFELNDSEYLKQKRDIFGFIAILALLRKSIYYDQTNLVYEYSSHLIDSLMALDEQDPFYHFQEQLFNLIRHLLFKVPCISTEAKKILIN